MFKFLSCFGNGEHNTLKGAYFEREVLLVLLKRIIDGEGGLVERMNISSCRFLLNYHLETGEEVEDKIKAFHAGGVDFISKPFENEEVLGRVTTHMPLILGMDRRTFYRKLERYGLM